MSGDRIKFDGDLLDEVFVTGATVHLESLDAHTFMLRIRNDNGVDLHLECENARDYASESWGDLNTRIDGPPLLGCSKTWDAPGTTHRCTKTSRHRIHECDCGATP